MGDSFNISVICSLLISICNLNWQLSSFLPFSTILWKFSILKKFCIFDPRITHCGSLSSLSHSRLIVYINQGIKHITLYTQNVPTVKVFVQINQ